MMGIRIKEVPIALGFILIRLRRFLMVLLLNSIKLLFNVIYKTTTDLLFYNYSN
jgi:hypothetical protein